MSEETNHQAELPEQIEQPENNANQHTPVKRRRGFFTRRNLGIALLIVVLLAVGLSLVTIVGYRYGVLDNYIKSQFVAKMKDIGVDFSADRFALTINPLKLELRNATFNDRKSGDKLFFIKEADIYLTVQNLYAWQLSRDISVDRTVVNGLEAWVGFDENGKSNFSNLEFVQDEAGSAVNLTYDSLNFTLNEGLVHFGDIQHKISADAKNLTASLALTTDKSTPDNLKTYKINLTSKDSSFIYDESVVQPIDILAEAVADNQGADVKRLEITSPLGSSTLTGRITDFERLQYDLNIASTVDLTETSTVLPVGTPIRGIGNFQGRVTGEGTDYKIDGQITSDALSAENIYLKALNVNAIVDGNGAAYEANGKAVAELLTFQDFKIDFPQIVGSIRGTGTNFRWVGALQAAAAKSPLGTVGGLYLTDAAAEYKEEHFGATIGSLRVKSFNSSAADAANLRADNIKIGADGDNVDVTAPSIRADNLKTDAATLQGLNASGLVVKKRGDTTSATVASAKLDRLETKDARLKNLRAGDVALNNRGDRTDIKVATLQADGVDTNAAQVGSLTARGVDATINGDETVVYSNNLQIARLNTDAATIGTLNIAGVRLSIKQGRIEARTDGAINAGDVALNKSIAPDGGALQDVRVNHPVFVLEPSGSYRATADVSLGGGVYGSVKLGAASASLDVNNERAALKDLRADVMDGRINGDATIAFNNRAQSSVNAAFDNLDIAKLLALQGGRVIPLEGSTGGTVNLTFNGTNFKTASGNLTADIAANAGTSERGLVPLNGRVEVSAVNGLFSIDTASIKTPASSIVAGGNFDLNGDNSNLNVALDSTDAAELLRLVRVLDLSPALDEKLKTYDVDLASNLSFNGTLTGNISDPNISGRALLDTLLVHGNDLGTLRTDIVYNAGGLELNDGSLVQRDGGSLAFGITIPNGGTNNIAVSATLDKVNVGNILAALPVDLPETLKGLDATASGAINVKGLPTDASGEANITAIGGTIEGQTFDKLTTRVLFEGDVVSVKSFDAQFGAGSLTAAGQYNIETTAFDAKITGNDVALARLRPFISKSKDFPTLGGAVDLNAVASGSIDDPATLNINFSGTANNVAVGATSLGKIDFNGDTSNQLLSANVTANIGSQPQTISAQVNFGNPNLPFTAETNFDNTELAPFLALVRQPSEQDDITLSGRATGKVFLGGELSRLKSDGTREYTTDNLSGAANFSQLALQIGDTPLVAQEAVAVSFNTRQINFDSAKFSGGGTNFMVSGTYALTADGANNLAADGRINLAVLNPFVPDTFFSGFADINASLTGNTSTARLIGTADLQNTTVSRFVGGERLTVNRIQGRVRFNTNQAQIESLTGYVGGGRVNVEGGAVLDGLSLSAFRIALDGRGITAPLPEGFITSGDADFRINGRRNVAGGLDTFINGTFNARRILYSQDIDLATLLNSRGGGDISQTGGQSTQNTAAGVTRLNIRVIGRDALVVRNNIADLTASLDLTVGGDTDNPQVTGRIAANSGTLFFRNDRYEIVRGILEFPPNTQIEPIINLQAETEINGYQILVNLNGSLTDTENLNASVRSNPALPESDVISLITTGSTTDSSGGIPTLAQGGINTAAEVLTDQIINKPLSKATDKLFGLNVFEIDPSISGTRLNPSARLTVGRQINRNLKVTYSTNLSDDQNQILALEYRVSNKLSFIAQYEQRPLSNVTQRNSVFSVEIRLRRRF